MFLGHSIPEMTKINYISLKIVTNYVKIKITNVKKKGQKYEKYTIIEFQGGGGTRKVSP